MQADPAFDALMRSTQALARNITQAHHTQQVFRQHRQYEQEKLSGKGGIFVREGFQHPHPILPTRKRVRSDEVCEDLDMLIDVCLHNNSQVPSVEPTLSSEYAAASFHWQQQPAECQYDDARPGTTSHNLAGRALPHWLQS